MPCVPLAGSPIRCIRTDRRSKGRSLPLAAGENRRAFPCTSGPARWIGSSPRWVVCGPCSLLSECVLVRRPPIPTPPPSRWLRRFRSEPSWTPSYPPGPTGCPRRAHVPQWPPRIAGSTQHPFPRIPGEWCVPSMGRHLPSRPGRRMDRGPWIPDARGPGCRRIRRTKPVHPLPLQRRGVLVRPSPPIHRHRSIPIPPGRPQ